MAVALPPTPEEQALLTPEMVLEDLMKGNERYVAGELSDPMVRERITATAKGQYPKAFVLSCIDSRVAVEEVFDQGIGDIFVGRVAGNVENVDQLGSMEFAAKVAGVKLVMVLGHESCGAVKGACDHVKLGNLTELLAKIEPAMEKVDGFEESERNSKNPEFVHQVVLANVNVTTEDIRENSSILAEMEKQGEIMIVGAVYDLDTGKVTLLDAE